MLKVSDTTHWIKCDKIVDVEQAYSLKTIVKDGYVCRTHHVHTHYTHHVYHTSHIKSIK
jgi:hypothetical protein